MLQVLLQRSLRLVVQPSEEWHRIQSEESSFLKTFLYTGLGCFILFFCKFIGGWFLGSKFFWNFLESFLFALICLGTSLSIGLFLIPCSKFARRVVNDGHAMRLSVYSSTPLWFWSFLLCIPSHGVKIFYILFSMAHCSILLFLGLPRIFGTEPLYTLSLALLLSGAWVLTMVLMSQVFLGMAFAL